MKKLIALLMITTLMSVSSRSFGQVLSIKLDTLNPRWTQDTFHVTTAKGFDFKKSNNIKIIGKLGKSVAEVDSNNKLTVYDSLQTIIILIGVATKNSGWKPTNK